MVVKWGGSIEGSLVSKESNSSLQYELLESLESKASRDCVSFPWDIMKSNSSQEMRPSLLKSKSLTNSLAWTSGNAVLSLSLQHPDLM